VWTARPHEQSTLVSDLNLRIERGLRTLGVQMPVAQRELHVRSAALDRVAAVLGGRFGEDGDETAEPMATGDAVAFAPDADGDASEVDRDALLARMRGEGGVAIADRRHLLTVYPRCFVGSEAVDWLVEQLDLTRAEAVALGERLVECGDVRHVLDEHGFRDGRFFYRFVGEDARPEGAAVRPEG
jgi:hypothetical protein